MKYIAFAVMDSWHLNGVHCPSHIYGKHSEVLYNTQIDAINACFDDVKDKYKDATAKLKYSYYNEFKGNGREGIIICLEVSE